MLSVIVGASHVTNHITAAEKQNRFRGRAISSLFLCDSITTALFCVSAKWSIKLYLCLRLCSPRLSFVFDPFNHLIGPIPSAVRTADASQKRVDKKLGRKMFDTAAQPLAAGVSHPQLRFSNERESRVLFMSTSHRHADGEFTVTCEDPSSLR